MQMEDQKMQVLIWLGPREMEQRAEPALQPSADTVTRAGCTYRVSSVHSKLADVSIDSMQAMMAKAL